MVMRAFDYGELDRMRATQDSAMMDTCLLGERVELSRDVYGMPVVGWSWGDPVICGLNPVKHVEIMDGTEVVLTDAVLRLPIDTVITHVDRVQITRRYGETLITPWVFACIGMPRRGPSGLLLNLRLVTFGAGIAVGSGSGSGAPLPIGSGSGSGTPLPGSGSGSGAPLPGSGSGSGWPMGSGSGSGSGSGEPVDPYAGYLLYDSFMDPDTTPLPSHTPEKAPVGALWSLPNTILGNRAYYDGVGRGSYIPVGVADVDITWILENTGLSPGQPGVCFRVSAGGATYLFLRVIAGSLLFLDQDDMTNIAVGGITWSNPATLRVVVVGNNIDVYWNGGLVISVLNAYAAGGTGLGFWSWGGTQAIDTLSVVAA